MAGMNAKAQELGMTNSHFANPNGLNDEGHYSSARDMALLARACLENEYLAQMVSTRTITLEGAPSPTTTNCCGDTRLRGDEDRIYGEGRADPGVGGPAGTG